MPDKPASPPIPAGPAFSRRRLLGGAALAGGAAAVSLALPPNVRKALAAEPAVAGGRVGHLGEIKHVVILMQENRSFDHYFGTLSGVRGYGDPNVQVQSNGRSVFFQPDPSNPDGYLLPYHLDSHTPGACSTRPTTAGA
jgi:phospholipase C